MGRLKVQKQGRNENTRRLPYCSKIVVKKTNAYRKTFIFRGYIFRESIANTNFAKSIFTI